MSSFLAVFGEDPHQPEVEAMLDRLFPADPGSAIDPRILKVLDLIRAEPDRNYTQRELADALGLSP